MVLIPVLCPVCGHDKISKRGKTENGKQRYFCQHPECLIKTFILGYDYNGRNQSSAPLVQATRRSRVDGG